MIPPFIQVVAFFVLALLIQRNTYLILASASLFNLVINEFTHEDDLYLMVVYSLIDYITLLCIIEYGDIDKIKQTLILASMITLHLLLELDQVYGGSLVFNWYVYGISALIIAQILGAKRGMDRSHAAIRWPNADTYYALKSIIRYR